MVVSRNLRWVRLNSFFRLRWSFRLRRFLRLSWFPVGRFLRLVEFPVGLVSQVELVVGCLVSQAEPGFSWVGFRLSRSFWLKELVFRLGWFLRLSRFSQAEPVFQKVSSQVESVFRLSRFDSGSPGWAGFSELIKVFQAELLWACWFVRAVSGTLLLTASLSFWLLGLQQ